MIAQLTFQRIDQFGVSYFSMDPVTEKQLIQASKSTYSWHHVYKNRRFLKSKNVSGTVCKTPTNVTVSFKKWEYEGKSGMYSIVEYPDVGPPPSPVDFVACEDIMA